MEPSGGAKVKVQMGLRVEVSRSICIPAKPGRRCRILLFPAWLLASATSIGLFFAYSLYALLSKICWAPQRFFCRSAKAATYSESGSLLQLTTHSLCRWNRHLRFPPQSKSIPLPSAGSTIMPQSELTSASRRRTNIIRNTNPRSACCQSVLDSALTLNASEIIATDKVLARTKQRPMFTIPSSLPAPSATALPCSPANAHTPAHPQPRRRSWARSPHTDMTSDAASNPLSTSLTPWERRSAHYPRNALRRSPSARDRPAPSSPERS